MPSVYDEVVALADEQIANLQAAERSLNAEIAAIKDKEWEKPLSPKQREQLQELRQAKAAVLAGIEEVSYVTLGALDKTDELKRLQNAIAGATKTLKDELEDLAGIQKMAETSTKILNGLKTLGAQLGKLGEKKSA